VPQFPVLRINSESMPRSAINQLIYESGFNKPFVIVGNASAIGIKIPDKSTTFANIAQIVGPQTPTKLIEVGQQSEITGYTLQEYAEYLATRTKNHKTLNMITLEFSSTPLNSKVLAPSFVRDIDWIDSIWPLERRARGDYPKVQKYCLAGMATSYTDFHIDFGGTSVWYHVLSGKKRFYLVPPTVSNLKKYEKWSNSPDQADVFFGDLVQGQCFQFELNPGETFMIPSGWIHSVYTPVDSLVFGGNFVHSFSILRQLQVYLVEYRTRVGNAYRFPYFREINWYFLCVLLPVVRKMYLPHTVLPLLRLLL
jgi:F-box/leucine-rich repeat protein 10/11